MTRRKFKKSTLTAAALVGTGAGAKAADVDVVVIGAGAAGLAATDALIRDGYTVQCIEAANRIGGRVFSDTSTFGVPMDYGAHWLHNRSLNPFVNIGRKLGLKLYKAPSNMRVMVKGRDATDADEIAFFNELEHINHAIAKAAKKRKDVSAASVIGPKNPWNLTASAHIGSLSMARDMADVSVADCHGAKEGVDWFCAQGFGTLLAAYHAKTPVTLGTRATSIDASTDSVIVETNKGALRAKSVIVTVSQGILKSGKLAIKPKMDSQIRQAIGGITMGSYNHITLQFAQGTIDAKPDSWIAYQLTEHKNGSPTGGGILANISGSNLCYLEIGGSFGKALEAEGEATMIDFGLAELTALFGANIRNGYIKGSATRWGKNANVLGAYSGALPGMIATRQHLHMSIAGRIFLAGEATSFGEQATVSGAHKEGLRAAKTVSAMLG